MSKNEIANALEELISGKKSSASVAEIILNNVSSELEKNNQKVSNELKNFINSNVDFGNKYYNQAFGAITDYAFDEFKNISNPARGNNK